MLAVLKTSAGPDAKDVEQRITSLEAYARASVLVGYCPLRSEVDVSLVVDKAIEDGKKVLLPDLEPGVFRMAKADWRKRLIKLENGTRNPSLKLLKRLAHGMGMQLKIEFVPMQTQLRK